MGSRGSGCSKCPPGAVRPAALSSRVSTGPLLCPSWVRFPSQSCAQRLLREGAPSVLCQRSRLLFSGRRATVLGVSLLGSCQEQGGEGPPPGWLPGGLGRGAGRREGEAVPSPTAFLVPGPGAKRALSHLPVRVSAGLGPWCTDQRHRKTPPLFKASLSCVGVASGSRRRSADPESSQSLTLHTPRPWLQCPSLEWPTVATRGHR